MQMENMSPSAFFGSLGNVLLMVNDEGEYYYPSYDIDQIGNIDKSMGYQVYIYDEGEDLDTTLDLTGMPASLHNILTLEAYKRNIISYIPQIESEPSFVFEQYIDNILLVKNDDGLFFAPHEGIITYLPYMSPGEGYYVYLKGDDDIEFKYPLEVSNRKLDTNILDEKRNARLPKYYQIQCTGISHPIIISEITGEVAIGDELAAYAHDKLVGAVKITSLDQPIPLTAFGAYNNFDFDLPGYIKGEEIELRLWSQNLDKELIVISQFDQPRYAMSPLSRGTAEVKSLLPDRYSLSQAYPNPFNPSTTINFGLPEDADVVIKIYDLIGREVKTIIDKNVKAGYHHVTWNAYDYSSGVYFLQMVVLHQNNGTADKFVSTQKLMLVK